MAKTATMASQQPVIELLSAAEAGGLISVSAAAHIRTWLTEAKYARYAGQVAEHIRTGQWKTLDNVFWTVIPFGTGGRRGLMYPIGCNAINERTIGESAQGLASYVRQVKPCGPWSCAIAYDTRHRSREFAELCAAILVASEFTVYFIDDYRSTPELSFLVRYKRCDCGIMVTASHNPPSDNAVKVYWSNGAQLVPPHDRGVIEQVGKVDELRIADFAAAVRDGKVVMCRAEADRALLQEHLRQSTPGPRDLRIIYSPLHGVGEFNVRTLLAADGFEHVEIYEPHRQPNGDFPNVPDHVANPENAAVFAEMIRHAQSVGGELILATDPDCDRMGAAAPLELDPRGPWRTLNGNQLSCLLAEFVLRKRQQAGTLSPAHYVVTTLVTSPMIRRICTEFKVRCLDQNLVGFKWICSLMDHEGPERFVYGTEESHGFLVGQYCRDKDGAVACMLMAQLAAESKARGRSVHQRLDDLYRRFGAHWEQQLNLRMEGSDGMRRMQSLMNALRERPPESLGGLRVAFVRDFLNQVHKSLDGSSKPLAGPQDNLIMLETEQTGNFVAVRPSGTEPKVKFYMFAYEPVDPAAELPELKTALAARLSGFENDLRNYANRT